MTLPSLLVCGLFLEVLFRTAIPAAEVPWSFFNEEEGLAHYDPEGPREGVFTRGRFAELKARWRINNLGWNSHVDYVTVPDRTRPLIAVIGDSYVHSNQVDPEDNIAAVLDRLTGDQVDVYRFGYPGAPLSHYLQVARYVRRHFDPAVLVMIVVHNDFEESLANLRPQTYFVALRPEGDGFVEVAAVAPEGGGWVSNLRRWSAFYRYWTVTLKSMPMAQLRAALRGEEFVANVSPRRAIAHREEIQRATTFIVRRMREENPDASLLFAMDAPRLDLYQGRTDESAVAWLTDVMRQACVEGGVPFLDLSERFERVYRKDGLRFESEQDLHWNQVGHREAARAIFDRLAELGVLSELGVETPAPEENDPRG